MKGPSNKKSWKAIMLVLRYTVCSSLAEVDVTKETRPGRKKNCEVPRICQINVII